jgi:hypothetical protein
VGELAEEKGPTGMRARDTSIFIGRADENVR